MVSIHKLDDQPKAQNWNHGIIGFWRIYTENLLIHSDKRT
jgi:hypothetical protein